MRSYVRLVIWLGLIVGGASGHAAQTHRDRGQIEEATRLQIFLDNSNFGPGKIDGRYGEFTRKAVMFFKRSKGQPDSGTQDSKTSIDTTGLDLAGIDPVFTTYVVNKGDIENVGEVPSNPAAQAESLFPRQLPPPSPCRRLGKPLALCCAAWSRGWLLASQPLGPTSDNCNVLSGEGIIYGDGKIGS